MAWTDHAETSQATTTTLSPGQQTHYDQTFLAQASHNLHMFQFAEKRPLPKNKGKTITFYSYNEIPTQTTVLTEGTNPAGRLIGDYTVTRTIREWGDWTQPSSMVRYTTIDKGLTKMAALFGNQAGRSIDLRIAKEVATCGSHALSCQKVAGGAGMPFGQFQATENGTTASTAALIYAETIVNTGDVIFGSGGFGATDNWMIGGQITFLSGQNYGQTRWIYDSAQAAFSISVSPSFDYAPADGDRMILSHPGKSGTLGTVAQTLAATDIVDHEMFATAREQLQVHSAPIYDGGYYVMLIGPTVNKGFMTDTDGGWMGLAQYRGQAMFKGEIGKYMGFRVVQTNRPFRDVAPVTSTAGGPGSNSGATTTNYELAGDNYAVNGAEHRSFAFGKGAFAVTHFPGMKTPKMIYNELGSAGSADPLKMQGSIGWKVPFVPATTNATWCIALCSGG